MHKLLLIDGSSMLSTNYYGNLPKSIMFERDPEKKKLLYKDIMQTSDGVYTNAMFGMLRTILKIIKNQQPEYIAFAFDKSRNTFRRELYTDYKGNRSTTPEPLKQQFINMENMLKQLGFQVFIHDQYEADDIIGTIARQFENTIPVIVMTKDHDYLQLVSDNIRAWMVQTKQETCDELFAKYSAEFGLTKELANLPDKVFEFTSEHVLAEEGVRPEQIIDLKGLVGDTSDNIPGVKGIAETASLPLLAEYGTIENIYAAIESEDQKTLEDFWKEHLGIKKGAYKKLIADGARHAALLSKKLATIVTVPDLNVSLEDMKTHMDQEELKKVCERYEFKSLMPTN